MSAYPGERFPATVTLIGDTENPSTRRVTVRCVVPNADGRLKPQMYATVSLGAGEPRRVVIVPENAVQEMEGRRVVFVADSNGRFVPREVVTARRDDGSVEIEQGLRAGERVVVKGSFLLKLVQLYDSRHRLLEQSASLDGAPPLVAHDAIAVALAGGTTVVAVRALDRPARMAVVPARRDGAVYAVAAGFFADRVEGELSNLLRWLVAVWLVALVGTGALGYALASSALRSVERITRRAASIARGDFESRLDPPAAQDELGRMTQSLNEVIDRLHGALQANRRFAADASHELRSPLTAMIGEIDVTLKHQRSALEYRDTLRIVRERLDALTALADDLMLLVRAQESHSGIELREVALSPVIAASVRAVSPLASVKGVHFEVQRLPELVAYADVRLLTRVFDNVLANAVRYNRQGGCVTVTATFAEAPSDAWQPGDNHFAGARHRRRDPRRRMGARVRTFPPG